jgi:hypothetical protein
MTNLPTLLEYLDEDINEAAKSVKQAISEKLAASTTNNSIILYNPQAALSSTKDNIENGYAIEDTISFNNAIVGYVLFDTDSSCEDAYEVKQSAALSGYGPLLYDLVLSHIYPNFLVSDRSSVSKEAQKVWNFYLNNRPDVNKVLITSIYNTNDHCIMPSEVWAKHRSLYPLISAVEHLQTELQDAIDFEEPLQNIAKLQAQLNKAIIKANAALSKIPEAHKYQIKSPKGLTALKNNHSRFIQTAKTLLPKSKLYKGFNIISSIDYNLLDAAENFFNEMY